MDLPANESPDRRLGPAVSAGLLFTSVAWMAMWIALVIVARHADSFQKIRWAPSAIWIVGAIMILAGALGAWIATNELAAARNLLRFLAAWLWLAAASIAVGRLTFRGSPLWPLPEIILGAILSAVALMLIARRRRKSP